MEIGVKQFGGKYPNGPPLREFGPTLFPPYNSIHRDLTLVVIVTDTAKMLTLLATFS
jgi:hypothetical protein